MEIRFQPGPASSEALILPILQDESQVFIQALKPPISWLKNNYALADFKGRKSENLLLYAPASASPRVLLAGLGRRADFTPRVLGEAMSAAVKTLAERRLTRLALPLAVLRLLPGADAACRLLEEAVLGVGLGIYAYTEHKNMPETDATFRPDLLELIQDRETTAAEKAALRKSTALIEGITLARNLINGPPNLVTPIHLEEQAANLAGKYAFSLTSYGPDELRKKGLNAFLAVSRGAANEPRLLILEHTPPGLGKKPPLVLLGKGITFDSGGISLKPAAGMEHMKRDMAGAGTLLGLFAALGAGGPGFVRKRILAFMPCAENMPSGEAARPGDIIKTLSGKTVEIRNTDAEGRLLLCDCLTLAQEMDTPEVMIDIATLTGACVVALGEKTAGLFSNNQALTDKILALAQGNGERLWPLPIWDEDIDLLREKSAADLLNSGPREGGACLAALFLKQFVRPDMPWAHLDIAGPAYQGQGENAAPGGATAFGLRTLLDFALEQCHD
ncbi:MAG: leucyl aminopeptidase [Desulfovibrionaceae bacterium]|nr:leucyl aminopeptidase [Desulfovibrionaceae bacterium]